MRDDGKGAGFDEVFECLDDAPEGEQKRRWKPPAAAENHCQTGQPDEEGTSGESAWLSVGREDEQNQGEATRQHSIHARLGMTLRPMALKTPPHAA